MAVQKQSANGKQPHRPYSIREIRSKSTGQLEGLELRVKIEGHDHIVSLDHSVLTSHGIEGLAAVGTADRVLKGMESIAKNQADQYDAIRDQTRLETQRLDEIILLLQKQNQ